MATKKASSSETKTTVTRIKANDTKEVATPKKKKPVAKSTTKKQKAAVVETTQSKNPFVAMGRYFKGAWQELRQVRWPNRRATWSLTAAMLVFTAFFVVLILLLDALFKYLFQLILG